jgi:hypothetical protein
VFRRSDRVNELTAESAHLVVGERHPAVPCPFGFADPVINGMPIASLPACHVRLCCGRRIVELYWVPIGFAVVVLLLVLLLARLVGNSKRREIRKKLGLPVDSRLTPEQASAFQAFENTDMKLKKSFPTLSDTQRQAMARDVLRDKGMLPKRKKSS